MILPHPDLIIVGSGGSFFFTSFAYLWGIFLPSWGYESAVNQAQRVSSAETR